MSQSLKTTWSRAILTFLAPLFLVLFFRWALFEPYVIPSGSMIPTLMIHDHILVNKWAFGFRVPFSQKWLGFWKKPQVGEIVVFRYPEDPETFFVKRVVAVEGDEIEVQEGQLILNGKRIPRAPYRPLSQGQSPNPNSNPDLNPNQNPDPKKISPDFLKESEQDYDYYSEDLNGHILISRSKPLGFRSDGAKVKVPPGHFFVVGDNRDESSDSRVWGFVPLDNLIGSAQWIWLSCEKTLPAAPFLCDPGTIRWERLFTTVE